MRITVKRGAVVVGELDVPVSLEPEGLVARFGGSSVRVWRDARGYYADLAPVAVVAVPESYETRLASLSAEAQLTADALPLGLDKTAWLSVKSTIDTAVAAIP